MKRIFDISLIFIFSWLFIPLLIICILLILIFDGYPVFFIHQRVGRYGVKFNVLKFRTMHIQKEYKPGSFEAGINDRVTKLGFYLRRTKLDEIPQLWNVLNGDMSLVGPRPEVSKWVNLYKNRWEKILQIRPGITDPASIIFRHEEKILLSSSNPEKTYMNEILPQKLTLYEEYVNEKSVIGDFKILLQSFIVLFK